MRANSSFRRYHRWVAVIMCLPLTLTVITGTAYPMFDGWLDQSEFAGFLLKIHSGRIFGLETIYPLLNGLGLIGLIVTGVSMTSLFRKKRTFAEGAIASIPQEQTDKELIQR